MARRSHRFLTTLARLNWSLVVLVTTQAAFGTVVQPDGLVVPVKQEDSNDYFETSNQRFRPDTLGLQSMFDAWEGKGAIDAYADGSSTNVLFSPLCGLTGSMILRGGACLVDFGWYCADDPIGQEVIHPLVTANDVVKYHDVTLKSLPGKPPTPPPDTWAGYQNNDKGFVPTIQAGYLQPVKSSATLQDVRNTAEYRACTSGKIGFAFKGKPTSICPMSKFSEPKRNQVSFYDDQPWINAIVYQSKKNPAHFYIAFEDMPTSAESFRPTLGSVQSAFPEMANVNSGWQDWQNDGDFNDFVYKVEGLLCQGGGQPCTPKKADGTDWQGACSLGVSACSNDPALPGTCQQRVLPTNETCNGWDDDCNGLADDGDGLCQAGYVCDSGKCVAACGSTEFKCSDPNLSCQTTGRLAGYCIETKCLSVECPVGQRCEAGNCVGGCDSRICPEGMQCLAGNCIDLCAGVACPTNFVCERGACIPDCKCLPCTDEKKKFCNSDGRCIEEACKDVVCAPHTSCVGGTCVDPCASEPCGAGVACNATPDGKATCPSTSTSGAGGTSPIDVKPEPTGNSTTAGAGSPSKGGHSGETSINRVFGSDSSCACRVAGIRSSRQTRLFALLGLALAALVLKWRARLLHS